MTKRFWKAHKHENSNAKRREELYVSNPNKFYLLKLLLKKHKGKKIIIFADKLTVLKNFSTRLRVPSIYGDIKNRER